MDWDISVDVLEETLNKFRAHGGRCNALVVVDPGNPTGMLLTRKKKEEVSTVMRHEIQVASSPLSRFYAFARRSSLYFFRMRWNGRPSMWTKAKKVSTRSDKLGYYCTLGETASRSPARSRRMSSCLRFTRLQKRYTENAARVAVSWCWTTLNHPCVDRCYRVTTVC